MLVHETREHELFHILKYKHHSITYEHLLIFLFLCSTFCVPSNLQNASDTFSNVYNLLIFHAHKLFMCFIRLFSGLRTKYLEAMASIVYV